MPDTSNGLEHQSQLTSADYIQTMKRLIHALMDKSSILTLIGKWTEAETIYRWNMEQASLLGDEELKIENLFYLAGIIQKKCNYDEAFEMYQQLESLYDARDDEISVGHVLGALGVISWQKGNFDLALKFHERQLHIGKKLNNTRIISNSACSMGIICMDQGDYDKALEFYHRDLAISEQLGNKEQIASRITVDNVSLYLLLYNVLTSN